MRLAVISDIHGNLVALEAVLAHIASRAPDAIVNLGDSVTSPLWPRETLELLETRAIPTVRGNHDRWLVDQPSIGVTPTIAYTRAQLSDHQRQTLYSLPAALRPVDGVLAVHGTPASDTSYLLEDLADGRIAFATAEVLGQRLQGVTQGLILCGHSHIQHFAAAPGGRLVLNPGSVGCPRYADNDEPFIAEAGSPHARYAIATKGKTGWSVEMIALEYDWSVVAERAAKNGRRDWEYGFLSDPQSKFF